MATQYAQYKMADGVTELSADTFNARFGDIDTRLVALEDLRASWEAAIEELKQYGLTRIAEALQESYDKIDTVTTTATALLATMQSTVATLETTIASELGAIPTQLTGADLTSTGGAGEVLKQTTTGGVVTVAKLTPSDLAVVVHSVSDATYTIAEAGVYTVSAAANNVAITLPDAANLIGQTLAIKRMDSSTTYTVTLSGAIDGDASVSLTAQYDALTLVSNGSIWLII